MMKANILHYTRLYIEVGEAKVLLGQRLRIINSQFPYKVVGTNPSNIWVFERVDNFRGEKNPPLLKMIINYYMNICS